jgi:hypothetical protein
MRPQVEESGLEVRLGPRRSRPPPPTWRVCTCSPTPRLLAAALFDGIARIADIGDGPPRVIR